MQEDISTAAKKQRYKTLLQGMRDLAGITG
jgi:hypothetical protein